MPGLTGRSAAWPATGRATPATHLVDRDTGDAEPVPAVGAFDPDARVSLQGAPLRLLLLTDAEPAGSDLNQAGRRADVEKLVVTGGYRRVESGRDS
jgi:hypothetical protein